MRKPIVALTSAALLALVLGMAPAQAKKNLTCVLAGGVQLGAPANLFTTTYGSGSFSASALLRCAGPVSGQATSTSSSFNFCQHNFVGPNPACHDGSNNTPNPSMDKVYDTVNTTGTKIAAHAIGSATFVGFTGGVSCSMAFAGHALGTQAELTFSSFTCTNGFVMNGQKKAYASAIPIINGVGGCPNGPGGLKACFKSLQFLGVIAVSGN